MDKRNGKVKYLLNLGILNVLTLNVLYAGSGKKNDKNKKGCCGSGKDKEKNNVNTEGSDEETEEQKKQREKEEEERKQKEQKDKEEADRLAKDKAALDKKRKDLLAKFNELKPRIEAISKSGYTDLVITSDIDEEKINSASATDIVDIENKLNTLEQNITTNEAEITKRVNYDKVKNDDLLPNFDSLNDLADLINAPEKYNLKVNKNITRGEILNSNYNQKEDIKTKLDIFEKDVKQKFEDIKVKLKEDMGYINAQIENNEKTKKKSLITTKYDKNKFKEVEGCVLGGDEERENFVKLNNLFNEISTNRNLIDLEPKAAKEYLLKELEKIKDAAEEFKINYNDIVKNINSINDNMLEAQRKAIPSMLYNFKIIKTQVDEKLNEYNKKNKDIVGNINNCIQYLKLVKEEDNNYKFVVDNFFNIDYSFNSKTDDYEDLKSTFKKTEKDTRDKFIKDLQNKYDENENKFKDAIKNNLNLLKEVYSSQIYNNIKIDNIDKKSCGKCGNELKIIIKNIYDSINSKVKDVETESDKQIECISEELKKELKDSFDITINLNFRTFNTISTVNTNFYLKYQSKEDIKKNLEVLSKDLKDIGCYGNDYAFEALKEIKCKILDKYFEEKNCLDYFIGEFGYKEIEEGKPLKINIKDVKYHDICKKIELDKVDLDGFTQEKGVLYYFNINIVNKPRDINNLNSYKENNNIDKLSKIIKFIKKIHEHNIKTLNEYVEKINPFIEYKKEIIKKGIIKGTNFEKKINECKSKISVECNILKFVNDNILQYYNKIFNKSIYWGFFKENDRIDLNISDKVSFAGSKTSKLEFKYFYFYNFKFFKQFSDFYYSYFNDISAICKGKEYDVSDKELKEYLNKVLTGKWERGSSLTGGYAEYEFYSIFDKLFYLFFIRDGLDYDDSSKFNVDKGIEVMGRLKTYFDKKRIETDKSKTGKSTTSKKKK